MNMRRVRSLEPVFYRAPSAHNTQPWVLEYSDTTIELRFDPSRTLPISDPTGRDLLLSLGAFVETCLIGASEAGFRIEFVADIDLEKQRIGRFVPSAQMYQTPFGINDIMRRQTSRLCYEPSRLPDTIADDLRGLLSMDTGLRHLAPRGILGLFVTADHEMLGSRAVVDELRSWMRLSKRDPLYNLDGLTAECLDLSGIQALGLRILLSKGVYPLVRVTRLYRVLTIISAQLLRRDGSVLVLTSKSTTDSGTLEAGRVLLRLWLHLGRHGYYTHPLSQIIDSPTTARLLAERAGMGPEAHIVSVFRVGKSPVPAQSPRLIVESSEAVEAEPDA